MNTLPTTKECFLVVTRDLVISRMFLAPEGHFTHYGLDVAKRFDSFREAAAVLAELETNFPGECGIASFNLERTLNPETSAVGPTQRLSPDVARTFIANTTAGTIIESRTNEDQPISFSVVRRTDSPYSRDTVDVSLDLYRDNTEIEISTASWRGTIEQTRAFAAALVEACDVAESRQADLVAWMMNDEGAEPQMSKPSLVCAR